MITERRGSGEPSHMHSELWGFRLVANRRHKAKGSRCRMHLAEWPVPMQRKILCSMVLRSRRPPHSWLKWQSVPWRPKRLWSCLLLLEFVASVLTRCSRHSLPLIRHLLNRRTQQAAPVNLATSA